MPGQRQHLGADTRLIFLAQGLRAAGYGFTAVVLGALLAARHYSTPQVGGLLAAVVAGTALVSVVVGACGDRLGRRRCYAGLYVGLAVAGVVFASTTVFAVLVVVALTGALSTDVVDNGPCTTLEQAMLADKAGGRSGSRVFGTYNAIAALAGSLGALAAGLPALVGAGAGGASSAASFLVLVPIGLLGAALALRLSPAVEAAAGSPSSVRPVEPRRPRLALGRSRTTVLRLSALFATDAFGGGFVVQSFIAFYLRQRFGVSLAVLGVLFFVLGLVQTGSFLAAPRIADRFGLLATMIGTHLPSNVLLAVIPLAGSLPVAAALLVTRTVLSQMDVPARQAYVLALVDRSERTAAAAVTNAARYTVRPLGPLLAGLAQQLTLGAPFVLAGVIKGGYDLALWRWFGHVPLRAPATEPTTSGDIRRRNQRTDYAAPPSAGGIR